MKFGPELPRRVQAAQERKRLIAEEGERYHYMAGEYRAPVHSGEDLPARLELHKLYGIEKELAATLTQLIQRNQRQKVERPTILLDFGGMVGLSATRIAAQPAMLEKIIRGEVIIAVSNLGFDLQAEFAKDPAQRLEFLSSEKALYVSTHRYLVQHIVGDASTLLRSVVTTPDGRQIPLRGNVDLVHERLALAHGQKNDLDIPRLGKLVSPTGELWLGTTATNLMSSYAIEEDYDMHYEAARQMAHREGVENLAELGLQRASKEIDSYQIYQHQPAVSPAGH